MAETIFNPDVLIPDRVVRITKVDPSTGEVVWTGTHFKDAKLSCDGENVLSKDELGTTIGQFDRSKTTTFSASSAVVSLDILADQIGSTKEYATSTNKMTSPVFELKEADTNDGTSTITLKHTPKDGTVKYVYAMTEDGSKSIKYTVSASAGTDNFTIAGKVITLGSAIPTTGVTFAVRYEYETTKSVKISNKADVFSSVGLYDIEVLFKNVCDMSQTQYGHIIFERGKMSNSVELGLDPESDQSIEITALVPYCSANKNLWYILITDDEDEE